MTKAKPTTKLYFNSTNTAVVIDDEGRTLGGGEFGEYVMTEQIRRELKTESLIDKSPLTGKDVPGANLMSGPAEDASSAVQQNQTSSSEKQ